MIDRVTKHPLGYKEIRFHKLLLKAEMMNPSQEPGLKQKGLKDSHELYLQKGSKTISHRQCSRKD